MIMPYTTTKKMLKDAQRGRYAIAGFNADNFETIQGVIQAAEEMQAPVMIQTTEAMLKYAPPEEYFGMVKALAGEASVPVALHLDHSKTTKSIIRCLRAGYTSFMIDGSMLPYEDNIEVTKEASSYCSACGLPIEAELGKITGKEDGLECAESKYTDPLEAYKFVELTNVFSIAVMIGTAHGVYHGKPKLDFKRLEQIRDCVDIPLVLHGASGIIDKDIYKCIELGICKINFATELRQAYTQAVRGVLDDKECFDPKIFGLAAMEAVKTTAKHKIEICGSAGKAV